MSAVDNSELAMSVAGLTEHRPARLGCHPSGRQPLGIAAVAYKKKLHSNYYYEEEQELESFIRTNGDVIGSIRDAFVTVHTATALVCVNMTGEHHVDLGSIERVFDRSLHRGTYRESISAYNANEKTWT